MKTFSIDKKELNPVISKPELYKRRILLTETANPNRKYPCEVDEHVEVGRSRSADICIPHDIAIGRHHCYFYFQQDVLFARDLGSINHTFVNGHRLRKEDGAMVIHDGDILLLGNTKFKVSIF